MIPSKIKLDKIDFSTIATPPVGTIVQGYDIIDSQLKYIDSDRNLFNIKTLQYEIEIDRLDYPITAIASTLPGQAFTTKKTLSGTSNKSLFYNKVTSTYYTADNINIYSSTDCSTWDSVSLPDGIISVQNFINDSSGKTYCLATGKGETTPTFILEYIGSSWVIILGGTLGVAQRLFCGKNSYGSEVIFYVSTVTTGPPTTTVVSLYQWSIFMGFSNSTFITTLYTSVFSTCKVINVKQNSLEKLFILLADNETSLYLCTVILPGSSPVSVTVSSTLGSGSTSFMEVDSNDVMYIGPVMEMTGLSILTSTDYTTFTPQGPFVDVTGPLPTTLRAVSGSTLIGTDGYRIYKYVYSEGILTRTLLPCSYDFTLTVSIYDIMNFGSVYVVCYSNKLLLSTYDSAIAGYYSLTVTGDVTSINPLANTGITIIGSTNNNGTGFYVTSFTVIDGVSTIYMDPVCRPFILSPIDGSVKGIFNQGNPYLITHNLNTTWPTIAILAKDSIKFRENIWYVYVLSNTVAIGVVDNNNIDIIATLTENLQHYYFKITK